MPTYNYECECGTMFERFFRMKDESSRTQCPKCDRFAAKILTAPRLSVDYPGYTCPVSGKWIEGRKAHRENLARTNCRILEPGEHAESARRRAAADRALDKQIGESVEAQIEALPTRQLEKLGEELQSGIDVNYARR